MLQALDNLALERAQQCLIPRVPAETSVIIIGNPRIPSWGVSNLILDLCKERAYVWGWPPQSLWHLDFRPACCGCPANIWGGGRTDCQETVGKPEVGSLAPAPRTHPHQTTSSIGTQRVAGTQETVAMLSPPPSSLLLFIISVIRL